MSTRTGPGGLRRRELLLAGGPVAAVGLGITAVLGSSGLLAQPLVRLQGFTENLPPLNHQGPDGPRGFAVELLRAMAAEAGLPLEISVMPWTRAVQMAAATRDSLLFSLTRLPARETQYAWVGPIGPRRILIYALASRPGLRLDDVRRPGGLRIGVVRNSAAALQLAALGLEESQLEFSQDDAANLRKLLAGRMDAIVLLDWAAAWNLRELGLPYATLRPLQEFDTAHAYWFGLRPDTDPALLATLQSALDRLRQDGRVEALRQRYFR